MDNITNKILQLNCQGAFSVVCDFGHEIRRRGVALALVQEPYTTNGCIRGLPIGMRSFVDSVGDSAIIIDSLVFDCVEISKSNWGVCVSVEGTFGRLLLASIYCRPNADLEP